jgi:uncharacterized delta-60 repeat protein
MKIPALLSAGSRAVRPSPQLFTLAVAIALISPASAALCLFDPTFNVGAGADGPVNSIVVDHQGNIWVGGEFGCISGETNAYLARLTPGGFVEQSTPISADGPVHRLAMQSDGRILVAGGFSTLQGTARHGLARFHQDGTLDMTFDAISTLGPDLNMFTLAIQPDGKILAASEFNDVQGCRVFRLLSDGQPDPDFANTNIFAGQVFSFAMGASNAILVGGKFIGHNAFFQPGLALMHSNGVIAKTWSNQLAEGSAIFTLATHSDGAVLVAGSFIPQGQSRRVLGRLTHDFVWDTNFTTDPFDALLSGYWLSKVTALLPQPDGSWVVGGGFYEVGGYNRRHLVRLNEQGQVDPCFDPGLGLGGTDEVRTVAQQTNGCILVGGKFQGVDGRDQPSNIARALPQSECGATRVHLVRPDGESVLVLGTFPPGGTNHLERSTNQVDWVTVDSGTNYYVIHFEIPEHPAVFFRVRKQY